jgi:hypothetical protein
VEFPFAYSHYVERARDPSAPPADTAAVLAAVARWLDRRPDVHAGVRDGEVRFRVSFGSRSLAFGGVRGGTVRAEPGGDALVLRYRMEFTRWLPCLFSAWAVLVSVAMRLGVGEIMVLFAGVAILYGVAFILKPLAFEDVLRDVPIPGHPHRR